MRSIVLLVFALVIGSSSANAGAEFGTKDEAVAMVHRVQEMFNKDGVDATFKAINDPNAKEFRDRDLYPFVYDVTGRCVAHGARPALIGKSLIDIKDQDGKFLIREMITMVNGPGHGWVDYKWPNPITNKIEDKTSYVEKLGDNYFVGVGVYR
jgi:signal transduction histidine kinase